MTRGRSLGATGLLYLGLQVGCAQPRTSAHLPPPDPLALQGYWEADTDQGRVTMTIAGDSLYYYRGPDFQYDTIFTLAPSTDPPELHATILDSPRSTDSAGELVVAIYTLEGDTLDVAVIDKVDGVTPSFDDAISRYRFERIREDG